MHGVPAQQRGSLQDGNIEFDRVRDKLSFRTERATRVFESFCAPYSGGAAWGGGLRSYLSNRVSTQIHR